MVRLQVAALDRLHVIVDGRSLCGRVLAPVDLYSDEAALKAWNHGPLVPCRKCEAALRSHANPRRRAA